MTPERWKRIEELYHEARARPPADRVTFLTEACADEAMRRNVESLLADSESDDGFLAEPAHAMSANKVTDVLLTTMAGGSLGGYELQGLLGVGGMGEVYRAHDPKLGRAVAIKILPRMFTSYPDRLARFEREARMLASLNHANICGIYGIEESDSHRFLILELVEGETLADTLAEVSSLQAKGGGLPLGHALAIARQLTDALEVAHEKGIVHRDLKPANIKITPGGVVKVLDFGLAKAIGGDGVSPDLSNAPLEDGDRRDGAVIGTAAYMSPEQARGLQVDKRTDIWAFGCVVYEMLTGRVAFGGDTTSDSIARVLEREPDWNALPPTTPAILRRLIERCLDKNPKQRLHDIADARIEIEDILRGRAPASTLSTAARWRRSPGLSKWVSISFVALVAATALVWSFRTPTSPPRILRYTMASSGVQLGKAMGSVAITPDGTRLVYIGGNNQIFVHPFDRLVSTAIATGISPVNGVFVSPDGQWVGFEEGAGLKKVAITGGPVTAIAATGDRGAAWAADDTIVVASADPATGLLRVSAGGGAVTAVTYPAAERGELDHLWPEMLPGGKAVLFTILASVGGLDAAQVAVVDLASGTSTVLIRGASHAKYAGGYLLYAAGSELRAVPFDLARLRIRGTPFTVLPRLVAAPQGLTSFAVGNEGTLAYVDGLNPSVEASKTSTLVWVDRQGREEPLPAPPRAYSQPRLSPDGTRVAVCVEGVSALNDIWVWDLEQKMLTPLSLDPAADFFPVWTSNKHIVFSRLGGGSPTLFRILVDGPGTTEPLGYSGLGSGVTPDGERLVFAQGARDLMTMALDGTRRLQPLIKTASTERNGVVSPNGLWLVYESDHSGRFEIYVAPVGASTGSRPISTSGGSKPVWSRSGTEIFFVAPDGALMAVSVDARGGSWHAGNPTKVVEGPYVTSSNRSARTYDVSLDGRRFLMVKRPVEEGARPQIVVVRNWQQELKAHSSAR